MIRNDDPSTSLTVLRGWMDDNNKTECYYEYTPDWNNFGPYVDDVLQEKLKSLCCDVCETEEYTRPDNFTGFTLTNGVLEWTV